MSIHMDVAVIGGGPAGYVAAIQAAQLGGRVILFERDMLGGTCLNRGCIPTKTYLKTAEYLHHIRSAKDRGIVVADPTTSVDMPKVVAYKDRVVKMMTSGISTLLKSNRVEVVTGNASLLSPTEILCHDISYSAEKIILCGGSKVGLPPIPGISHPAVLTSDEILTLTQVPKRLCMIGGGVIGCEMACAFQAFGCAVTIVELADRLLPGMDPDLSEAMKKNLSKQGIKIVTGQQVFGISGSDDAPVVSTADKEFSCDKVLISIGRVADFSCLGALADRIQTIHGKIVVDDRMTTNFPNIYACGDLTNHVMLAHAASRMGEIAAKNAMGLQAHCDLRFVPSCIYTLPEVSSVGLTEVQAIDEFGDHISVGRFPFSANGRATASGGRSGFVKVISLRETGRLLGVHIVGDAATELIAEPTALLSIGASVQTVVDSIIHAHPSYSEAFGEACADSFHHCIHLPPKN